MAAKRKRKRKVDVLDGDVEGLIKKHLPLLERMLANEQIIPRNKEEKEIMNKMYSMRNKMVRIISAYGKEITIRLKYIPWFIRLLNNEQIIPRNHAEWHALQKFVRPPDNIGKRSKIPQYYDFKTLDGRIIAWSKLTKEQQDALSDYILITVAAVFGYIPIPEAAKRKKEAKTILHAA